MKPLTVPTGLYIVHTNYSAAYIRYAEYAVHIIEYSLWITEHAVQNVACTVHRLQGFPPQWESKVHQFREFEQLHFFLLRSTCFPTSLWMT